MSRFLDEALGYLLAFGLAGAGLAVLCVFLYDIGFSRGWRAYGRAVVQAAVDEAVAEQVPYLVPGQREAER